MTSFCDNFLSTKNLKKTVHMKTALTLSFKKYVGKMLVKLKSRHLIFVAFAKNEFRKWSCQQKLAGNLIRGFPL